MKLSFRKLIAVAMVLLALALILFGAVQQALWALAAGFTLLALSLLAVSLVVYRHLVSTVLHVERLVLASAEQRRADARDGQALRKAVDVQSHGLTELVRLQEAFEVRLQQFEEATRTSSRQAADAQHFALKAFDGLSGGVREVNVRLAKLEGAASRIDDGFARADKSSHALAGEVLSGVEGQGNRIVETVQKSQAEVLRETEALAQLERLFEFRGIRPLLGGWAMEPSSMLALLHEIRLRKPELVVECGSGTSTLWIAYALAGNGGGRIVSFEHQEAFARSTRALLEEHGLSAHAEVRWAPLVRQELGEEEVFEWYDPTQRDGLDSIDILIVDGPPRSTGPLARYPAVPLLAAGLATQALIVVDDANRKEEKQCMKRWKDEVPGVSEPRLLAARTSVMDFRRP